MEDFIDLLDFITITVIPIAVLILLLAVTPEYLFDRASCSAKAEAQGYEYEFGMFKGCMVKTENGWIDYDRLIYKKEAE